MDPRRRARRRDGLERMADVVQTLLERSPMGSWPRLADGAVMVDMLSLHVLVTSDASQGGDPRALRQGPGGPVAVEIYDDMREQTL